MEIKKYLNIEGLQYLWSKLLQQNYISSDMFANENDINQLLANLGLLIHLTDETGTILLSEDNSILML